MRLHTLTVLALSLVLTLGLTAGVASADIIDGIEITGGTAGTIPNGAGNEIFGQPPGGDPSLWAGWYGAELSLAVNGPVTYTLIGGEAGYTNYFWEGSDTTSALFTENAMVGYGTSFVSTDASYGDTLDFSFTSSGFSGAVVNGSNPDDAAGGEGPNFFIVNLEQNITRTWGGLTYTLTPGLYIALDDGGAGPDDNHDDMVVRVSAVPEPTSLALLGLGLAGLAVARRRRRSS